MAVLEDADVVVTAVFWPFAPFTGCLWCRVVVFGCCALVGGVVGSALGLFCFVNDSCDLRKDVDLFLKVLLR